LCWTICDTSQLLLAIFSSLQFVSNVIGTNFYFSNSQHFTKPESVLKLGGSFLHFSIAFGHLSINRHSGFGSIKLERIKSKKKRIRKLKLKQN